MALRSEQARVLRRLLLGRVARNLAVFTAGFAAVCVVLELLVVGPLADFVADSTSTWRTLDSSERFEEIMDESGLDDDIYLNDLTAFFAEQGFSAAVGSAASALTVDEKQGDGLFDEGGAWATDADLAVSSSAGSFNEDDGAPSSVPFDEEARAKAYAAAVAALGGDESRLSAAQVAAMAALLRMQEESGLTLEVPQALNNADVPAILRAAACAGIPQEELTSLVAEAFRRSQDEAYEEWQGLSPADQALRLSVLSANPQWQTVKNPDGYWRIRDVSTYALIRSFKLPLAAAVLVAGWLVIVMAGLNRSLRYFDDLSGAVARLLADRDAPIELPPDLAIAQNELAVIRSQSLADERAAQAAERRKNELVAYLAHDIRTPLTSVLGYLDLLREASELPPDTQRKYAEIAYAKAERLEGLIGEFFEITRYNLQAIPIERENVDVRLFCQQVAESFFPETSARGIGLRVGAPSGVRFFVDPDKLARALGNVMRNAVAYAEDGTSVDLAAACDGPWVTIAVRNRGREISEAHLEAIFEKFYREDGARSTGSGGAGLGLAIAKEIVTAHGGDIAATSRDGVTVFTLRVPREAAPSWALEDAVAGQRGAGPGGNALDGARAGRARLDGDVPGDTRAAGRAHGLASAAEQPAASSRDGSARPGASSRSQAVSRTRRARHTPVTRHRS